MWPASATWATSMRKAHQHKKKLHDDDSLSNSSFFIIKFSYRIDVAHVAGNKSWFVKYGIMTSVKMMLVRTLKFPIVTNTSELGNQSMFTWRRILRIPLTEKRTNVSILAELNITERLKQNYLKEHNEIIW